MKPPPPSQSWLPELGSNIERRIGPCCPEQAPGAAWCVLLAATGSGLQQDVPGNPGALCQAVGMGAVHRGQDWAPLPGTSLWGCLAHLSGCCCCWAPAEHAGRPRVLCWAAGPNPVLFGTLLTPPPGTYLLGYLAYPAEAQHQWQLAKCAGQLWEFVPGVRSRCVL